MENNRGFIHEMCTQLDRYKNVDTGYTTRNSESFLVSINGYVHRLKTQCIAEADLSSDLIKMLLHNEHMGQSNRWFIVHICDILERLKGLEAAYSVQNDHQFLVRLNGTVYHVDVECLCEGEMTAELMDIVL